MAQWIFFDVGSTLVDEAAAYDHRVRDMISSTSITFQEFDNARIAFAKQGLFYIFFVEQDSLLTIRWLL